MAMRENRTNVLTALNIHVGSVWTAETTASMLSEMKARTDINLLRHYEVDEETVPHFTVTPGYTGSETDGGFRFEVYFGKLNLLGFYLDPYPACCALWQVNNFRCTGYPYSKLVPIGGLMDYIFKTVQRKYYENLKRVVFNFVEATRYDENRDKRKYAFGDIPPLEETNEEGIIYLPIYKWATSKPNQQMLFVNHNTHRIIHFTEVLLG